MMKAIVCFGDSNTYGHNPQSYFGGRYEREQRWVGILNARMPERVYNRGMNGRSIPETKGQVHAFGEMLQEIKEDELEIWVLLGTNDLLNEPKKGALGVTEKMERFLTAAFENEVVKERKPVFKLLVPPRMSRGTWVLTDDICVESKKFGEYYENLAGKLGIDCIRTDRADIPVLFDGVHFTEEGHRNLAEFLFNKQ